MTSKCWYFSAHYTGSKRIDKSDQMDCVQVKHAFPQIMTVLVSTTLECCECFQTIVNNVAAPSLVTYQSLLSVYIQVSKMRFSVFASSTNDIFSSERFDKWDVA